MRKVLLITTVMCLGLSLGIEAQPRMVLRLATMADQFAPYLVILGRKFEELTGVRVEVDILGYPELYMRVTTDFATGTQVYDLATIDIVWTGEFAEKGWTVDLMPLILRDYYEINVPDILPIMWSQGHWKGRQIAFPMAGYANSIIYRKDLFEDPAEKAAFKARYGYDLRPARTLQELRDIAEFFTRPEQNLYGLVANGARGPAVAQDWMEFMRMFGGAIIDAAGNVVVDSPECLASLKFFVEIFDKWAPPGAIGYWWDDRETSYRMGISVMQSSWSIARAGYEDPNISLVVGKTGMAVPPFEPSLPPRYGFGGWGIGINADIPPERQEMAWKFIKWITSPEVMKEWMLNDGAPIRLSTLLDPELNAKMPWLSTMLLLFIHGDGDYRPRIPEYSKIQDILGLRINQAITHELTPEEALKLAAAEIREVLGR
ncbi:MAG: sugar ABC transporter substrate-binding protein [Nitrososphaerota archaeon]